MTERNADDKQIKVTDKRMFTPDGQLREEFKDLGSAKPAEARSPETTSKDAGAGPVVTPGAPEDPSKGPSTGAPTPGGPPGPGPSRPEAAQPRDEATEYPSGAQFEELVALLAQTTVTFLQQATRPEARSESLEQAQLYLDLLGILEEKTRGNLAPGEKAMIEDALRQLRLAFAQRSPRS